MKAPKYYDGKELRYEEVFRSGFARPTEREAMKVLEDIRAVHDPLHGWIELEAYVEQTASGYVAVRHHAQYK